MKELMRLKATNGTIVAYEDKVVIARKGFGAFAMQGGFQGDRTIYYKDLSSIEYKKPGLVNGYIQFLFPGSLNSSAKVGFMGTSRQSAKDPNTVILRAFNKNTPRESEKLYKLLLSKIEEYKSPAVVTTSSVSGAEELEKLALLKEKGVITKEEFEKAKAKIIG